MSEIDNNINEPIIFKENVNDNNLDDIDQISVSSSNISQSKLNLSDF